MTALLITENIYSKTHQGTRTKFSELFIKTGIFPISVSDDISTLFEYRQEADYEIDENISEDDAKNLLAKATQFLVLTKQYFDHLTADNSSDTN